ncbi:MAG: Mur ligase domain-containing protein, partial [Ignavibacteriaceae bacterium]
MKKINITLKDLFNLPTASIYNPDGYKSAAHVTIDSRDVKPNSIFVAIKGEKFDGHDFVNEALVKGANAVIINESELKKYENCDGTIITVENTIHALGDLANTWRKKLSVKVIGITGSNGKTTIKEILSVLISEKFKVQATVRNNNNHIGVPLTIFSCNEKHQILIAETGTNHFGEISY